MPRTIRANANPERIHAARATANVSGALSILVEPTVGSAVNEMNSEKCPPARMTGIIGAHGNQEGRSCSKRSN